MPADVFRDADGNVFDEHGEPISSDDLDTIVWREDAPSYEAYRAKREAVADAKARIDALRLYQTDVLGAARDRLEDEADPPTVDELEDIQTRIRDEAPDFLNIVSSNAPDHDPTPTFSTGQLPKL